MINVLKFRNCALLFGELNVFSYCIFIMAFSSLSFLFKSFTFCSVEYFVYLFLRDTVLHSGKELTLWSYPQEFQISLSLKFCVYMSM